MKKFIFITILGILVSCSVEKRLYRQGFFVQTTGKTQKQETEKLAEERGQSYETSSVLVADNDLMDNFILLKHLKNETTETPFILSGTDSNSKKTAHSKSDIKRENTQEHTPKLKEIREQNQKKQFSFTKNTQRRGNDQLVAFLLCLFLGSLGIHSFYLGNTVKGAIQLGLFVLGCLFWLSLLGFLLATLIWIALEIWVFVDLIRIALGDLGPGW